MSSNDFEPCIARLERLSDVKSDKSGVVSGKEIFGALLQFPVGSLAQLLIAFLA